MGTGSLSKSNHFDAAGNAHMVDVSAKDVTVREAVANGELLMQSSTAAMIRSGDAKKGDVLGVARLAAIQATKLTPQLIPLCHAIPIESVAVEFEWPRQRRSRAHSIALQRPRAHHREDGCGDGGDDGGQRRLSDGLRYG